MKNIAQFSQPTPAEAMSAFASWLEDNDANPKPYFNYSGRCMYGKTCFGIVGDIGDIQAALIDFTLANPDMAETIRNIVKEQRRDNFGLDAIVYFPDVDIDPPSD